MKKHITLREVIKNWFSDILSDNENRLYIMRNKNGEIVVTPKKLEDKKIELTYSAPLSKEDLLPLRLTGLLNSGIFNYAMIERNNEQYRIWAGTYK